MIDTVSLWLDQIPHPNAEGALSSVERRYSPETCSWSTVGKLQNMRVRIRAHGLSITGSLSRYFLGNNCEILTRQSVSEAIDCLSDSLHVSVKNAKVYRFDLGYTIPVSSPVECYLRCLGDCGRYAQNRYKNSVTYMNGRRSLCFYDKRAEMKRRKYEVPPSFGESNLLRYEVQFKRRLKEQFQQEVTAYRLYDEDFYVRSVSRWAREYSRIRKQRIPRLMSPTNVKDVINHLAFHGILSYGGEEETIQVLKTALHENIIEKHTFYRVRRKIQEICYDDALTIKPQEIVELSDRITEIAATCQ